MAQQEETKILSRIASIEKRLSAVEKKVRKEDAGPPESRGMAAQAPVKKESFPLIKMPNLSFNQVITTLGVIGIIIGVISFFFYAVAHEWIGETAQIGIGIIVGIALFIAAYTLREKNETWSNIVLGGSFFIVYLSIGVGVHNYEVIPPGIGAAICMVFLASSIMLGIRFSSRTISYFSLVGGILVPLITGMSKNDLFVMSFYLLLSAALVIVSFHKAWPDLRFTSFWVLVISLYSYSGKLMDPAIKTIPLLFVLLVFLLYNISSIIGSFRRDEKVSILDSIILGALPVVILPLLSMILYKTLSTEQLGILVMAFSFLYLGEMALFRSRETDNLQAVYTLFSAGLVTLNIGFAIILSSLIFPSMMILFVIQWYLFSHLAIEKDSPLYRVYSYIFFGLSAFWYLSFGQPWNRVYESTIYLALCAAFVYGFYHFQKKGLNPRFYKAALAIGIFLFILSSYNYLALFLESDEARHILLSIAWITYTLILFSRTSEKKGKYLAGALLGIALLKVAFNDLFYLYGVYRILGFMLFGALLIIGGYLIKNEKT